MKISMFFLFENDQFLKIKLDMLGVMYIFNSKQNNDIIHYTGFRFHSRY